MMDDGTRVVCPRCGQDYVVMARVKELGVEIAICPECYATWPTMEAALRPEASTYGIGFVNFEELENLGVNPEDLYEALRRLEVNGIPWETWDDNR